MTARMKKCEEWLLKDKVRLIQLTALALICLGSFLFALYHVEAMGKYNTEYTPDEEHYIKMARRVLNGEYYGYWGCGPDAVVSPGLPIFLVCLMAAFGSGPQGINCIQLVQCLLLAATVLFTYLLAVRLTGKRGAGLLASLLFALNGLPYLYVFRLLTETLYCFLMMLFFLLFARAMEKGSLRLHGLAGLCFGAAVLVRPLIIIIAPFLYIPWAVSCWKDWKRLFKPLLFFAGGFVLICLPWWIRNFVSFHQIILLSTQTNPIYAGLARDVKALGLEDPGSLLGNVKLLLGLLRDDFFGTVYWLTFGKFEIIFMSDIPKAVCRILTLFVRDITVYLGLCGGVRALFSKKGWGPSLVFWVYLASSFLFVPTGRYALQYLPLLAILAVWLLGLAFKGAAVRKEKGERRYAL